MARLSAMAVPAGTYDRFLLNEGRVLIKLRASPHRNLPTLVACRDPGSSDDTGDGFVFSNPMYGDLYSEVRAPRPLPDMLRMFGQMVAAVAHCHAHGIVLGSAVASTLFKTRLRTESQLYTTPHARRGTLCRVPMLAGC